VAPSQSCAQTGHDRTGSAPLDRHQSAELQAAIVNAMIAADNQRADSLGLEAPLRYHWSKHPQHFS
jgi:D-alanyl-D-alanine carboxypeptidase